jgi:thiol-disulfide isomerase/thioredoxin
MKKNIFVIITLVAFLFGASLLVCDTCQAKTTKSTKGIRTLDAALKAGVPVIVKLGSESCPPCRRMKPIIKELAVEQDGKAIFLDIDIYENRQLASQMNVRLIPTILYYDKHGKLKTKSEGFMSKEELLKAIKDLGLNK